MAPTWELPVSSAWPAYCEAWHSEFSGNLLNNSKTTYPHELPAVEQQSMHTRGSNVCIAGISTQDHSLHLHARTSFTAFVKHSTMQFGCLQAVYLGEGNTAMHGCTSQRTFAVLG